jgi:hypothetical protein
MLADGQAAVRTRRALKIDGDSHQADSAQRVWGPGRASRHCAHPVRGWQKGRALLTEDEALLSIEYRDRR